MNDKNTRVAGLRDWVQRDEERREREKELPRAICRVCGGWAKAGQGFRGEAPQTGLRAHPSRPGIVIACTPTNAPTNTDDWRRECATCAGATMGAIVSQVTGIEVAETDARAVVQRMSMIDPETLYARTDFPTAQSVGGGTGHPWAHVRAGDRDRVRGVLREVIDERLPGISKWGACGLCGRRHSIRWTEGPAFFTWPDGTRAPVCAECQQVMDRRPEVTSIKQLRVIGVEAATGFSQMLYRAPDEFRLYAESKDSDGNGHAEPWTYSPGIITFREAIWGVRPHLAPAERRREFEHRFRNRIDEAHHLAQAKREAVHADAW